MTEARTCRESWCETCARMRVAAVDIAAGRGVRAATESAIARGAQITAEEARRHYASADECLADAYEEGFERLLDASLPALTGEGTWQERLLAAGNAAIAAFADQPQLARFCVVEAWRIDMPALSARRMEVRDRFVKTLADHRRPNVEEDALPELRFEIFAGATRYAIDDELQDPACTTHSLQARFGDLVRVFEPAPTASAA
jgi:AcrR family transcriptional regulator